MTILYCDCFSGISGDMFLSALIDAGLSPKYLSEQLAQLGLPGFRGVSVNKVLKGAIQASALHFDVETDHNTANSHHEHSHHRNLTDIVGMITGSALPAAVQNTAITIFQKLAEAEARVHGSSVDEVRFHEVGAIDSILDIVGAAIAIHHFNIDQVYASSLPLGSGQVQTQHGLLPLPAPATLELIKSVNAPLVPSPASVELVTPTGAAILCALAKFQQPSLSLQAVGIGAGKRDLPWPNILRLLIGSPGISEGWIVEIETNIDDMNPQFYGSIMERLFEKGALDVYFTPIVMKKNRPATKLSVLCRQEDELKMSNLLLQETTTLGVRVKPLHRYEAERETRIITTDFGEARIKIKRLDGKIIQISPEYDDCVQLANHLQKSVAQIYNEILQAANQLICDLPV